VSRGRTPRGSAVEIVVDADDIGFIWGWPGGLRLAVDNLVRNAIAHGAATRITLTAANCDVLTIVVDDNGGGLPVDEHQWCSAGSRGEAPHARWSGLGCPCCAAAALHGGSIELRTAHGGCVPR